jgi:L-aspartate oxidase
MSPPTDSEEAAPLQCDVAVIGGGAAGLHIALEAAARGASVRLVSRTPLTGSASFYAQGGLAAALGPGDSPHRHVEDTLAAGRGACRTDAVEVLARGAPAEVERLIARGVAFDTEPDGTLALALEGGHSARRIVHAGGSETGRAITGRLAELVAAERGIEPMERTSALALWSDGERCVGAITDRGPILAAATVLATGGGAALWSRTTNPWGAIGAGSVFAHAAGAELADLELCQFHPTALALPGSGLDGALITEAVRGEGARLVDAAGRRFVDELAPRDEVTAAILERMAADGVEAVGLDLRPVSDLARFATVARTLAEAGIDPSAGPVPVAPAAHYLIGGVLTDLDARSTLTGLYAVGEATCTGLHGANRLASNSLSECFVFGTRGAAAAVAEPEPDASVPLPDWRFEPPTLATRAAVWEHAGPQRSAEGLARLLDDPFPLARMIAASALERRETRGAHRRVDHPATDPELDGAHFVCAPGGAIRRQRWL